MTYSTLASIIKYPYSSLEATDKPKFGYFESETEAFRKIVDELGLLPLDAAGKRYCRHPLVYLVETADDICYQIMDIEDAHHLKLLTQDETQELLLGFFDGETLSRIEDGLVQLHDQNEQVAYLRSRVISLLVNECSAVFNDNEEAMLQGAFEGSLIQHVSPSVAQAYQHCSDVAYAKIYRASDVVDIEVAGYQIITVLLEKYLEAVLHPNKTYSQLLLDRVPSQYDMKAETIAGRVMAVLDFVSGMTDVYALDLYRKIYGMSLPSL